jgi:hypothetical protein
MHSVPHIAPIVGSPLKQHYQPVRVIYRQLSQQDLVNQGEDRGIRANSQSERKDSDCGEEGTSAKRAQGEPEVRDEVAHVPYTSIRAIGY